MGSIPATPILIQPKSDAKSELVSRILSRTMDGKITWTRHGQIYAGQTEDGQIRADLTLASSRLSDGGWSSFSVKNRGKELLMLDNQFTLMTLAGVDRGGVKDLVTELVFLLEERETQDVREAIRALDTL